ncbi:MAG: DNA primase [Deltaproteobacteria bacterium]|nr:DNA primase [Deltaproteobacteria bacterium]
MGKFNNEALVKEIKGRLSIINLVESYTSVKKTGKGYVGLCPFHDDSNPSMHVDEEKGLFHCFSCGAGGDIFGFYMRYNNLTFPEAFSELAKKADVNIERQPESVPRISQNSVLYKINAVASKYYRKILIDSSKGKLGRDYMQMRSISAEIAQEFSLGFAPEGWDSLVKFLTKNKVPLIIAEKVGLIVKRNNTDGYYDRFRNRLIFPISNVEGKVIGFGGRKIKEEDQPKYINSPESDIYQKRKSFYGIDKSKDHIRREARAVLVEGYTDFLSLYSAGIKNVVATLGTSLTREHVSILRRYTDNVVVIFDSDESGRKAAMRSLDVLLEEGLMPHVAPLPLGKDPDSYIIEMGRGKFAELIENSTSWVEFFIDMTFDQYRKGRLTLKQLAEDIVELLEKVKDPLERNLHMKTTAERLSVSESEIYSLVKRRRNQKKAGGTKTQLKYPNTEKLLFTVLLKFPDLGEQLTNENWEDLISTAEIKSILEEIIVQGNSDPSSLLLRFDDKVAHEMISEALLSSPGIFNAESASKIIQSCIVRLKLSKLNEKLKVLRIEIDEAVKGKDAQLEKKLLEEYRDLTKQKQREEGRAL